MPIKKNDVDQQLIRDLAGILDDTNLTEIEVESGDFRVRVSRQAAAATQSFALPALQAASAPQTPAAAKGMMLAGLAYFVLPADAIPDVLAVVGFTDDAAVFAAMLALVGKNLKPHHRAAAEARLRAMALEESA